MGTSSIVFLIDDDDIFAEWLGGLASSVGIALNRVASVDLFLKKYQQEECSCLIINFGKPHLDGARLLEELSQSRLDVKFIVLTDDAPVHLIVRAAQRGAVAFLQKQQVSRSEVLEAIQLALEQQKLKLEKESRREEFRKSYDSLNDPERKVLEFMVAGEELQSIADQLEISRRTVEKHRDNGMRKLNVNTFTDLIALLMEHRDRPPVS